MDGLCPGVLGLSHMAMPTPPLQKKALLFWLLHQAPFLAHALSCRTCN